MIFEKSKKNFSFFYLPNEIIAYIFSLAQNPRVAEVSKQCQIITNSVSFQHQLREVIQRYQKRYIIHLNVEYKDDSLRSLYQVISQINKLKEEEVAFFTSSNKVIERAKKISQFSLDRFSFFHQWLQRKKGKIQDLEQIFLKFLGKEALFTDIYYQSKSSEKENLIDHWLTYPRELLEKRVNYSHLGLTSFPRKVLQLHQNLEEIDLSNNCIQELSEKIVLLRKIKVLNLQSNQLLKVPTQIFFLKTLEMLDLSDNQLDDLPSEISKADSLTVLYLQKNKLKELPEEIGKLKKLKKLILDDNQLCKLPTSFAKVSLTFLSLKANHFKEIPPFVLKNKSILYIDFSEKK